MKRDGTPDPVMGWLLILAFVFYGAIGALVLLGAL